MMPHLQDRALPRRGYLAFDTIRRRRYSVAIMKPHQFRAYTRKPPKSKRCLDRWMRCDPPIGIPRRKEVFNDQKSICSPVRLQHGSPGRAAAAADGPVKSYGKSYRFEQDGWIYLHIEGAPYERGMQHGFLLAPELDRVLRNIRSLTYLETGKEWDFFVQAADRLFTRRLDPEFLAEIKGIAAGQKAGVRITW